MNVMQRSSVEISVSLQREYDKVFCSMDEIIENRDELEFRNGIYFYYAFDGTPLYVGISTNLYRRAIEHLKSKKTVRTDLSNFVANNGFVLRLFFEDEFWKREIVETYLIHKYSPLFNRAKTEGLKR